MHGELCVEVGKGVEAMGVAKATLILAVATLYLAVVTGRIWKEQLVQDRQCSSRLINLWDVTLFSKHFEKNAARIPKKFGKHKIQDEKAALSVLRGSAPAAMRLRRTGSTGKY